MALGLRAVPMRPAAVALASLMPPVYGRAEQSATWPLDRRREIVRAERAELRGAALFPAVRAVGRHLVGVRVDRVDAALPQSRSPVNSGNPRA